MIDVLYFAIILILFFNLIFSVFLELLNIQSRSELLPDILSDVYDSENYAKQQRYEREKVKLSIIESIFSSVIILSLFGLHGFGYLQVLISGITPNQIIQTLLFFGILGFASLLLSIPFDYYNKFVIEEGYGFNKTTKKLFLVDILKTLLLSAIIGGALLTIITWLFLLNPQLFWITTLGVMIIFSLLMNALYSSVILPLFNKKTKLEDGILKQKIVAFAESVGFSINNIYIIDGSKRTTKANAFFTGFGSRKRIFLYDNLSKNLADDEILAVLAHELGHYKKHHIWINLAIGIAQSAILLYIFSLVSLNILLTKVMGGVSQSAVFYLNILCFILLIEPIQAVIGIILNMFSRKMEYEADRFANSHGMGHYLISALKKLSSMNYSNLTPHPFYVFMHYSHPPLLNRIKAIMLK